MKKQFLSSLVTAALLGSMALSASAQNLAVVNGKPVPKERAEMLKQQLERSGRPVPAEMEDQIKEEVITREIFMQEANRRGLAASSEYRQQMELARETVLIRELFTDFQKKNPVTDAEIKAEYDKFISANEATEFHAAHILVESEDRAKAIIAEVKGGKKFEDIAKKESKDPGSGAQGGDLNWANAASYVPEFAEAMVKLDKGQMTDAPVKSEFGWHVIRVLETRQPQLPALEEIKPQISQQLEQQKLMKFQDDLRAKAKIQ